MKRPGAGQISTTPRTTPQAFRRLSSMATTTTVCAAFAGRLSTAFWTHLPHSRPPVLCSRATTTSNRGGHGVLSAGPMSTCNQGRSFGSGSKSRTASRRRRDRTQETRHPTQRSRASATATATTTVMAGGRVDLGKPLETSTMQQEGEAKQLALPFGTAYHVPVVCEEVLEWLITDPEGVYVDCTLGGGGHSAALLGALDEKGRVVGLDRDPDALREASKRLSTEAAAGRFEAVRSNFADVGEAVEHCHLLRPRLPTAAQETVTSKTDTDAGAAAAAAVGISSNMKGGSFSPSVLVDGILVDLGVSSHQIDDGSRGFSFSVDGPLDMRMEGVGNSGSEGCAGEVGAATAEVSTGRISSREEGGDGEAGGGPLSAADVVNFADEMEIREMVWRYGDEKRSTKIATAIVENRPISTTGHLAEVVGKCAPPNQRMKTLARVFQALRIEVNGELDALEALLEQAKFLVKPGGRLLILSYHSLEDRRVKRVLATGNLKGKLAKDLYGNVLSPWKPLLRKPLMAGEAEVALNPRARSVRLRVAERTTLPL